MLCSVHLICSWSLHYCNVHLNKSLFPVCRFVVHLNKMMRYAALCFVPWFTIYCVILLFSQKMDDVVSNECRNQVKEVLTYMMCGY